jgi:hypothetical protein
MEKNDKTWGGRREGSGRKALPLEEKKINMTIKVKPATADVLRRRAKEEKVSIGTIIENLL